jgi:chromosome segregation ATPase
LHLRLELSDFIFGAIVEIFIAHSCTMHFIIIIYKLFGGQNSSFLVLIKYCTSLSLVILGNIFYRADEEIKDANDAIVYYKEEEQRYKNAKDDNNAQIIKLRTEKEDANGRLAKLTNEREDANRRLAKLTNERDDANRRLAKLKTERDQSNADAASLKVEKDELLNKLQKQKSSNDAGQHCKDALSNQLHEKDMECKQSKKIVENLNRKLDEIQSQQKEFLKPR